MNVQVSDALLACYRTNLPVVLSIGNFYLKLVFCAFGGVMVPVLGKEKSKGGSKENYVPI
jgi:hypothetical protein